MAKRLAILIVEDSESDAQLIVRLLKKSGYDFLFRVVETAAQMHAALTQEPWDIVISDYSLPQFNGHAALRLLQETGMDIPFIAVSGTMGEETAVTMMKSGAHDYLMKSNLARLAPAVERELRDADTRRERWRAEEALRQSTADLHTLAMRLQTVREEERAALSRELHDDFGQLLTALHFDLMSADSRLQSAGPLDLAMLRDRIAGMVPLVERLIEQTQTICSALRPSMLDNLGLVASIEWLVEDTSKRTGMIFRLSLPAEDVALDRDIALALFRIVQESLTNVARHAQATHVEVKLHTADNVWELEIQDNGRGFAPGPRLGAKALGLLGMAERASAFGGTVTFLSEAGQGVTVRVKMPSVTKSEGSAVCS